jgi:hypothetical protein
MCIAYNPNFAPRSPSYDNSRTPGHVSYRPDDTVELSTATMSKLSKLHRESMRATGDWLPPDGKPVADWALCLALLANEYNYFNFLIANVLSTISPECCYC